MLEHVFQHDQFIQNYETRKLAFPLLKKGVTSRLSNGKEYPVYWQTITLVGFEFFRLYTTFTLPKLYV